MDAHLPICKGAKVDDVFTTCFRKFGFYLLYLKKKVLFFEGFFASKISIDRYEYRGRSFTPMRRGQKANFNSHPSG